MGLVGLNNMSVTKKLLLGFVVSSIFILGIGGLSLVSINKAKETALLRSELEHQVALIRNVRMHLIAYRIDRIKYRRNVISNGFQQLLKANEEVAGLLKGREKVKMDSIGTDILCRAEHAAVYLDNALVYDSLANQLIRKTNQINSLINKDKNSVVVNGMVNDKLQWLQTRLLQVKLRPGQGNTKDFSVPAEKLLQALKNVGHEKGIDKCNEQLVDIDNFKEVFENDKALFKKVDDKFSTIVAHTNNLIKQHSKKNEQDLSLIWNAVILITVLGGLLVYVISRYTSNSTVKGISSLNKISNEVSKGRIGVVIPKKLLKRKDEIGSLASSYQKMLGQFKEVVGEITESAQQILTAGDELKESSQSISVSASQQAASLEEISGTVEEIVANIQQNAGNAISTKEKAQVSADGLKQLKEQNDMVFQSSMDIDDKTKIINEMAFQTNILSLNAAVEAAMAGVYGKSFGVVAAEVKKLAERSKDAAGIIVSLTKEGIELTKKGSKLAEELLPQMESTNQLVNEIAMASQEQQMGAEQINTAIGTLNTVSQENSVRAEQLSKNAIYLNQQSDKLQSVIDFFSVDSFNIQERNNGFVHKLAVKLRFVKNAV